MVFKMKLVEMLFLQCAVLMSLQCAVLMSLERGVRSLVPSDLIVNKVQIRKRKKMDSKGQAESRALIGS